MIARRTGLAVGVGLPALAWVGSLWAQTNAPLAPVVIGWLSIGSRNGRDLQNAFTEGMAALGWKLGAQYVLEERHGEGQVARLPALAQELAAMKPAVIVAWPSVAARAANQAAPTTPVVLLTGDALAAGLVTSLARPGGMITGSSNMAADTNLKVIELLVESVPKLRRIGFVADSTAPGRDANVSNVRRAAERFRFEAVIVDIAKPQDIEPAFVRFAKTKVQALVILPSAWFNPHLPAIVRPAMAQGWPVAGTSPIISTLGGLFHYGADAFALARRSAYFVDRILKGAKPGDLPIEQPTVFELVLNLKTATALGITFAPSMRVRATEVIE